MPTNKQLPLLIAAATIACSGPAVEDTGEAGPPDWVLGEVVDTEGRGVLARIDGTWGGPLWLLRVEGDHHTMGYQHGRLIGPMLSELWWTYMGALGAEMGVSDPEAVDGLLGTLLDKAWGWYEPHTPEEYLEEIQGMVAGMEAAGVQYGDGVHDLEKLPQRLITLIDLAMSSQLSVDDLGGIGGFLANGLTDDLMDWYGDVERRLPDGELERAIRALGQAHLRPGAPLFGPQLSCSYFAAWGERTDHGGLYMTRNMDFASDTGIADYAMITTYVPEGGIPYVSISWLGASLGVLAGVSQEGIAIGAVGSSSSMERLDTEPALFRAKEVLERAQDLEGALPYLENTVGDGLVRAPTIGYNALISWGDPRGGGAGSQALVLENNGLSVGGFLHQPDGSVEPFLLRFARDGSLEHRWGAGDRPDLVNQEGDAREINEVAEVRLFAHDGEGNLLTDDDGRYYEDPDGIPIQTGFPEAQAVFRGDEAMAYGVRIHQYASNGPARGNDRLMVESGSWRSRYMPMGDMTRAWETGGAYEQDGELIIPDNGGAMVPVGLDEAELVSRVAAMSGNVWDVVYDATDLVIRLSYESGRGEDWVPASEQPPFMEIQLRDLFLTD